ncbi:DNA topoisomerase (ATP-hydrolyzing) [Streptomyces badius]
MTATEVTRELGVDIALRWGTGYDTTVRSFVNIIATPKGGTHVTGFERSLTKTVNEALRSAKMLRVAEDDIVKDDALEGLTAVVTVRLAEPQFEGQTKEVLGTSAANRIVANVVAKELKAFLTSTKRDAKAQARAVLEKAVAAARTRSRPVSTRTPSAARPRWSRPRCPPSSPTAAATTSSAASIIVEGDSALGAAKLARNSEFQALLPIRGKILNVQKSSVSDMLKNAECGAIIQVIGAGSGRTFDIDAARYGKIVLLVDADVDGAHIRCLLLTLFQRYMRPMVEAGRVFAAVPPLHRIELVQPKKGQDKYVYTYSDSELRQTLLEFQRKHIRIKAVDPALQGPRRDRRPPAGRDDDGPAPPHAAAQPHRQHLDPAEQVFDLLMAQRGQRPREEFTTSVRGPPWTARRVDA